MIKANRQTLPLWFFDKYFSILQKILFREVEFRLEGTVPDGPVLLLQNHFSWWDGYWSFVATEKVMKRRFHVMMLEKELARRKFLSRTGAFSIDPEGRNVLPSMRYSSNILKDPRNSVTIYPQGRLISHYAGRVVFEKGAEALLRIAGAPVNVVFAAAHVSYGSPVRPRATIFLKHFEQGLCSTQDLEAAYNAFYLESRDLVIRSEV
ncbi:MAG: lysophospholipid acyltransferase family protein [Bacteroidota bacterium]